MAPNEKIIKFCSINIQGWSEKSRVTLDHYNHKGFAAIFVQECMTDDLERIKLTNMKVICDNNKSKNRGAAICINKNFPTTKLKDINESSKHIDASWCLTIIHNKRYILGSVYIKQDYKNGIDDLLKMLDKAYSSIKKHKAVGLILTGDLNARHPSWGDHKSNEYGEKLFKNLDRKKFAIVTASTPTFLCKNKSTVGSSYIDMNIMTTSLLDKVESCKTNVEVELFSGAPDRGHVPLLTSLTSVGSVTSTDTIEKLNIDQINWETWSEDLDNKIIQNEDYLNNVSDPQILSEFLDETIQAVTNNHGEKKVISMHSRPYWTKELERLCREMREARKIYNRRNTDANAEKLKVAKETFDEERKNECRAFIMKKTEGMNKIERLKFWREFNKMFRKKADQNMDMLVDEEGNILSSNEEMEECMFNTFFEGQHLRGGDFDKNFYDETNRIYEDIMNNRNERQDHPLLADLNSKITMEELKSTVKSYNASGKSSDKQLFNPKMFKHLGIHILNQILRLANQTLEEGKWIWNKAEVIFLKKMGKDNYSKPGSYRPISISSYIGKLIEKIIAKRIQRFLDLIGLHDPDQEGFMEARNTIRYLNRLVMGLKSDIQKKITSICLFIDFEKAFDSVWKKGLIVKMHDIGIKGKMLYLINDFLVNRKITLNINGVVGNIRNCSDIGLPQGSALSPVLFRIFVMDLADTLNNRKDISVYKFADDGTIKVASNNTKTCIETLNYALGVVYNWTIKWRMIINCEPDKTEVIGFNTAEGDSTLIPNTFSLGAKSIKRVYKTKVLGLVLDENLDFKDHSKHVLNKLQKLWYTISQYSNRHWGFNKSVLTHVIKTLFLPTLFYASHIWMSKENMKDINTLYYKIIKAAIGAVFNIRQTFAEIILGIAPLSITNDINQIKHILKLNMTQIPEDRLRKLIEEEIQNNESKVNYVIRQVFKFLKWKLLNRPDDITHNDQVIIQSGNLEQYFKLSPNTCKYTKTMMTNYTEYLWNNKVKNELQGEGLSIIPVAKCTPIPIPKEANREEEVLIMSLFYPNNLLNIFTNRYNAQKFPDPTCSCGQESQTPHHVLFRCGHNDHNLKTEIFEIFQQIVGAEAEIESHLNLLKACKHANFIKKVAEIIKHQKHFLRTEIVL